MTSQRAEGGGCAALIAILLVISLVVAAVISVAALVDPFSWVPPIGTIFDCTDNPQTAANECDLGARYPGWGWHVIVNFVYALVALGLFVAFAGSIPQFRQARHDRFESSAALDRYQEARLAVAVLAALLAALAALPIIAALV
jgi:hypothetical protein